MYMEQNNQINTIKQILPKLHPIVSFSFVRVSKLFESPTRPNSDLSSPFHLFKYCKATNQCRLENQPTRSRSSRSALFVNVVADPGPLQVIERDVHYPIEVE